MPPFQKPKTGKYFCRFRAENLKAQPFHYVQYQISVELVVSGKALWWQTASGAAGNAPQGHIILRPHPPAIATHSPAKAFAYAEANSIGKTAIFIPLQSHALPFGHFGYLNHRENNKFAVFAHHRHILIA
jgi:hypothetical protein